MAWWRRKCRVGAQRRYPAGQADHRRQRRLARPVAEDIRRPTSHLHEVPVGSCRDWPVSQFDRQVPAPDYALPDVNRDGLDVIPLSLPEPIRCPLKAERP
jgi:hypothetical protein